MSASRVRVASIQVASVNGEPARNLGRAEGLVADAVARGAEVVLCPEFLAAGYVYDVSIWEFAERRDGPTETWLCRLAKTHGVHLGASYLEVDDEDFFNTFTLARPDGSVAGRVRKESLPAFEGWFFKSCGGPKVIATELGRIGVGICQDNHTARFWGHMVREAPDLLLMPHSAPCFPVAERLMRRALAEIGPHYARAFGVPAVVANKAAVRSRSPIPGVPLVRIAFEFPGMSTISDSDGRRLEHLPDREGVLVAEVSLDPARKRSPAAPSSFYWSRPPDAFPNTLGVLFVALERLGTRAYGRSRSRVRSARRHGTVQA